MASLGMCVQVLPASCEKLSPVPICRVPIAVVVSTIVATHTVSPTASSALMEPRPSPFRLVKVTQSPAEVPAA